MIIITLDASVIIMYVHMEKHVVRFIRVTVHIFNGIGSLGPY